MDAYFNMRYNVAVVCAALVLTCVLIAGIVYGIKKICSAVNAARKRKEMRSKSVSELYQEMFDEF